MRTTRRKLLGLIGLGAAAAALGTSGKAAEAAPDAIAQARADGYNRGYAVADARAQSRQEQKSSYIAYAFDSTNNRLMLRINDTWVVPAMT